MKPTLLTLLTPLVLLISPTTAAYPRFKKYEECVSHCDADPACRAAYFDTITGDCQVAERVSDQTPPDRFRAYIKGAPAGVSAPFRGQTGTMTEGSSTLTSTSASAVGTGTETGTGVGTSPAAATETSGAGGGWGVLRADVGVVAAVGGVVVGFLG
jgi:hypothetical protein